uniref:Uncharacterized protein n=1 Tax=Peronospora matthiolae TaxID=2874970 RepID=A0AAV1T1U7_9STRA
MPCSLAEIPDDLSALQYSTMVDVYNTFEVMTDSGFDDSQPPDVDITVYDEHLNTHALMGARKLRPKRQQLSALELDALIAEFVSKDPAYLHHLYKLPTEWLERTFRTHAVFRASRGVRLPDGQNDILSYLQSKFVAPGASMAQLFDSVFPTVEARRAALTWSKCDLFLMIFAPGIYFDPVKLAMLMPGNYSCTRLRLTPFLLWSNLNLQRVTQTDVLAVFLTDPRTPDDVRLSIQVLKDTPLPAVATASSQVVPAHL